MADNQLLSTDVLQQVLRYEPETGKLFWRERPESMFSDSSFGASSVRSAAWSAAIWNSRHAGKEAFTADNGKGYRQGKVFGGMLKSHRVAWALHHGQWPDREIDHINGDKSDNRASNLRLATAAENACNKSTYANNTSGYKGVSWSAKLGRWQASIKVGGKQSHLGFFDDPAKAHRAYSEAAHELHGDFARTI